MKKIIVNGIWNYNSLGYWLANTPLLNKYEVLLCLLEDDHQIKNLADSLNIWKYSKPILTWVSDSPLSPAVTDAFLHHKNAIILTTTNNLKLKIPSLEQTKKYSLSLEVGSTYNFSKLITQCQNIGFEPNIQVNLEGEVAARGGIIDLGLFGKILRLEFSGNNLESIHWLTLHDQTKIASINIVQIPPLNITMPKGHLEDYLSDRVLTIGYQDNNLPQQLIISELDQEPDIVKNETWPDFSYLQGAQNWQQLRQLSNYSIYWLSSQSQQALKIIKEHHLKINLLKLSNNLLQTPPGWQSAQDKILVLNDNHLLPPAEKLTKRSNIWLAEIKPGDYVVHRDHGIGQLINIEPLTVDGITREYLTIEYAAQDKIYLPTDQADKISKYVGPSQPKISRLSNDSSWINSIKKIKEETWALALKILRHEAQRKLRHIRPLSQQKDERLVADDFPFEETPSQLTALSDTLNDLAKDYPTERLICGDVGFGKTEIALRASWRTVLNGGQVALICPTTILAQQHFDTFNKRLSKYGADIELLSRWQTKTQQHDIVKKISQAKADIVVGTHRLLSRDIKFSNLRLLIIDEEQNFGVKDKEKLKELADQIHVLSLSATPIPRTLHLSLSNIRNISLLTEPPKGRQDIKTEVLPWNEELIKKVISNELKRHGQVYYLHNKVETIDFAKQTLTKLFPKAKLAIAHGQMDDKQLARTMHNFDEGKIDILICSTIITNGLDLANVNTIIVTDTVNFGLAQLHQLRGRVGRSDRQAYAYFLYNQQKLQGDALERLKTIKRETALGSGFRIANRDMELRGVGNILGKNQHGRVKAIGLQLYQELIEQSVNELRGMETKIWRQVEIELPLDTALPDNLFPHVQAKIFFWQQLAAIRTTHELQAFFKNYDGQVFDNIRYIQGLRILAQDSLIEKISARGQSPVADYWLEIFFTNEPSVDYLKTLLQKFPDWIWTKDKLKIKKSSLQNWHKYLKDSVISLQR